MLIDYSFFFLVPLHNCSPEDKAKVLERKALAKQPEQEKKKEEEAAEDIPAPEPIAVRPPSGSQPQLQLHVYK